MEGISFSIGNKLRRKNLLRHVRHYVREVAEQLIQADGLHSPFAAGEVQHADEIPYCTVGNSADFVEGPHQSCRSSGHATSEGHAPSCPRQPGMENCLVAAGSAGPPRKTKVRGRGARTGDSSSLCQNERATDTPEKQTAKLVHLGSPLMSMMRWRVGLLQ